MKILIVGSGLTGSLTAYLLSKAKPSLSLTVWDKARGAGGRMSVHRWPANPALHVDMGAQYISKFKPTPSDTTTYKTLKSDIFTELLERRILQPFDGIIDGVRDDAVATTAASYIAPKGMNTNAKHFLSQSGASVAYEHQLRAINIRDNRVCCEATCGTTDSFDAAIVTLPLPQILALQGNVVENLETGARNNLEKVKYSSRYALGLFYKDYSSTSEWVMKYCSHPIIRFVSWDARKKGLTGTGKHDEVLLVHTSVPFAVEHSESDKSHVEKLIISALAEVVYT